MFWSETLKESSKFCTCHAAWYYFRIVHIEVIDALLSVYVTPEEGNRSFVFSMRRGEQQLTRLSFDLKFKSLQHVKFEVEGGEITLVGESYDSGKRTKYLAHFLSSCPFADEEDWKREKIGNDKEEEDWKRAKIDKDPNEIQEYNVKMSEYKNYNDHVKLIKDTNSDNVFVKADAQTENVNDYDVYDDDYDKLLRKVDLDKVFLKMDTDVEDKATLRARWLIRQKEMERQNKTISKIGLSEDDYDNILLKADITRIFKIQPDDDMLVIEAKKKVYEKVMERRNKALLKKEEKNIQ